MKAAVTASSSTNIWRSWIWAKKAAPYTLQLVQILWIKRNLCNSNICFPFGHKKKPSSVESKCIYYSNKEDAAIHRFVCVFSDSRLLHELGGKPNLVFEYNIKSVTSQTVTLLLRENLHLLINLISIPFILVAWIHVNNAVSVHFSHVHGQLYLQHNAMQNSKSRLTLSFS